MVTVNIDFNKADTITNEINNTTQDMSNISDSVKGISADAFASYSPGTVSLTEEFKSLVSKMVPSCDNFLSKFRASIQLYKDAYEEQKKQVEEEIVEEKVEEREEIVLEPEEEKTVEAVEQVEEKQEKVVDKGEVTIEKEDPVVEPVVEQIVEKTEEVVDKGEVPTASSNTAPLDTGPVTIILDEEKQSEIKETTKFYFNYQGNVSEVKEMSSSAMATLFEQNGAMKGSGGTYPNGHSITRGGNGWYMFEKGGHTYEYNVNTNEIIVDYTPPSKIEKNAKFNCKMFTTKDTDYNSITNTITILGGQGILEVKDARYDNDSSRTLMTGVNANKNSLIMVPYGRGYGTIGANIAPGAIASTTIGNFMVGGNTKKVTNSIVGFSLGGQATYQALASSKGLYQKAVIVNSGMQALKTGSYDNMKDVEIIIMQANNDKTFGAWAPETLRKLVKNGVPKDNINVYTNSGGMLKMANQYLSSDHVHNVTGDVKGTRTWSKHNYGIDMIKSSGILNYLSL